jgi:very-short-patch-repair endonuclease
VEQRPRGDPRRLPTHSARSGAGAPSRGYSGTARVAALLREERAGSTVTRNDFEELFLSVCREHGLPDPLVNAPLLGLTVDFFWPPVVVVEADGAETHLTRRAFEDDRDRDSLLVSHGYRVMRFTWRDLTRRPRLVADRVRRALIRSASH